MDDNYNQSLAQLGFVVINFAYRGSGPWRGRDFHTFGYGNLRVMLWPTTWPRSGRLQPAILAPILKESEFTDIPEAVS